MRHSRILRHRAAPIIALGLCLGYGVPAGAQTQGSAPVPGQSQADQALQDRLRLAVESLRESERHLGEAEPDWGRVGGTVARVQGLLHDLPVPGPQHDALERAQSELSQAKEAVEARSGERARAQLRAAADALGGVQPGLDTPPQASREDRSPPAPATPPSPATVPSFADDSSAIVPAAQIAPLIGTAVVGATGADVGRIENFLAEPGGRVRAAVVSWGGIAGLGERRSVIPIERIQLGPASVSGLARLEMTRDELEEMPRYDRATVADLARQRGWGEDVRPLR